MSAPGRVRGRARGRARAQLNGGADSVPSPPPGYGAMATPQQPQQQQMQLPVGQANGGAAVAQQYRGDMGPPVAAMEAMRIGPQQQQQPQRHEQQRPPRDDQEPVGEVRGRGRERGRRRGSMLDKYCVTRSRPEHASNKTGGKGDVVTLFSNHISLDTSDVSILFVYHVDFTPDIDKMDWRYKMLLGDHREMFGNMRPIFDGSKCVARVKLPENPTELVSNHPDSGERVRITLKYVNELPSSSPEFLHTTNVMFRNYLLKTKKMFLIGRNYYSSTTATSIPQYKIDVLSGYDTSILCFETGLHLEIDLSHKVLRAETALDVIYDIQTRNQRMPEADLHRAITRALMGSVVMTRYNNKTYRVSEVDFELTPKSTFETREGPISYLQYFAKQYGVHTLDHDQCMLVIKPKARDRRRGMSGLIYLPPQICLMTGLTDDMRSNFKTMQEVAKVTRIGPPDRFEQLRSFARELNSPEARALFEPYGYKFAPSLLQTQARVITGVTIKMGSNSFPYKQADAEWGSNMRNQSLLSAVPLRNWVVICDSRNQQLANDFARYLPTAIKEMGIQLADPIMAIAENHRDDVMIREVKKQIQQNRNLDMVVVILPSSKKSLYDGIKKVCCIEMPVTSQCIIAKTLKKQPNVVKSVVTKVALQMQVKMGGELWAVTTPRFCPMMVIGIDTYHDSGKTDAGEKRSAVGVCCSLTMGMTRYFSQCSYQGRREEIVLNLTGMIANAVRRFHTINNTLPFNLIVYRDGVGDGQLDIVQAQEIPAIERAFQEFNQPCPKITYIIVKKRISTRFFVRRDGQVLNPLPGTVVDNTCTRPEWYDFFLVSQSVRQGTVSPTHYNIIRDDSRWSVDQLQKLTYWLTHLYYNWPGTVRVPAPCQYAHKMAFLHGQSFHQPSHPSLCDKLFFL